MSTFDMLDVAIGITFTFLLLSLIATAFKEIIETLLKTRAENLEKGIRELLQDPTPNQIGIVADLYNHSLIAGLYRGPYVPKGRKMPSYIPASNFALALLDTIMPATANNLSGSAGGGIPAAPGTTPVPPTQAEVKSLQPLRTAIIAKFTPAATPQNAAPVISNLGKAILSLVDSAGDDIDKARTNIENWYNTSMDRVSGWYKRNSQWWLFFIGLVIAVIMNADTIAIYKSLMKDPTLRNAVAASAQGYVSNNKAATESIDITKLKEVMNTTANELYDLRLPIGYDWHDAKTPQEISNKALAVPDLGGLWALKFLGWVITALAISLGSAFWFDTLNKIMVIRSTVKPHEKSPEEASQDKQKK